MYGLSIVLAKAYGIFGVLLATAIARMFITTMYDPYLLHKLRFKTKCSKFYLKYLYYAIVYSVNLVICLFIGKNIFVSGIFTWIFKGILTGLITFIVYFLFTLKMKENERTKELITKFISKITKKRRKNGKINNR